MNNKVKNIVKMMAVLMGLFVCGSMLAQNGNVGEETARQVGLNFLRLKEGNPRSDLQLTRVDAVQYPNLYVYNTSENGFIVVSSDNRMEPILAYSDEGTFDKDSVASGANFWFEMYEYAIDSIVRNNVREVDEQITRKWDDLINGVLPELERSGNYPNSYGPLIHTHWGQGDSRYWSNNYNALCPWIEKNGQKKRAVTGCTATALAQVLNYYYVDIPQRSIWYSFRHNGLPNGDKLSLNGVDGINQSEAANGCNMPERKKYNIGGWNNLSGNNRIAKMMLDCGLAVDTEYGLDESGAWTLSGDACYNQTSTQYALVHYFGFPNAKGYRRSGYIENWILLLKDNLFGNNPIIYRGTNDVGNSHSFICDGYYYDWFHFNFGHRGYSDGYYLVTNPNEWKWNQGAVIAMPTDLVIWNETIPCGQNSNHIWCDDEMHVIYGDNPGTNQNNTIYYNSPGHYHLRNHCTSSNKTLVWNVTVKPNAADLTRNGSCCKKSEYHKRFEDFYDEHQNNLNWHAEFNLSRDQTDFDNGEENARDFFEYIYDTLGNIKGRCKLHLKTSDSVGENKKNHSISICDLIRVNDNGEIIKDYYSWDADGDGIEDVKCYGDGYYEFIKEGPEGYCETIYSLDLEITKPDEKKIHHDTVICFDDTYKWRRKYNNTYALPLYRELQREGYGWKHYFESNGSCSEVNFLHLLWAEKCKPDMQCIENKITNSGKSAPTTMEAIYYGMKHYFDYRTEMNGFLADVLQGMIWPSMEERNIFWNHFQSLLDTNTGMMSEEAMQQLIATNPYDYITEEYVGDLVERYNRSVMYWNEGYFTFGDLPEGYNYDFIEYDTAAMNKAYEACDYAIAHGFSDVKAMYDNAYEMLESEIENQQTSVCARVTVQFTQKMTMTREAFNGTLQIFNGHESVPMEDIMVDFRIKDAQGNDCTNLFQINTLSLDQITGISGDGSLAAQTNGTALVQFIPTKNAAPTQPTVYYFGGSFSFIDPFTGEGLTYPLYPVDITVNPSPDLHVDYFMQRDILGDDALTLGVIEPSIPAELGVIIHNKGAGIAKNVTLETAEPEIIDNEHGLAIEFAMYGASFNGSPRQLGLMEIPFGNIESGQTAVGEWLFTSSLLGHFVSYTAHVIHNSSYDNPDLSLVSHLDIHELVHPIYAYGNLDDSINDFLVNDNPDAYDTPDSIYFSHGGKTSIGVVNGISFDHYVSPSDTIVTLTVVPSRIGWNYGVTDDPGMNEYEIISCIRNEDNQVIPLNNVWQTFVTIPDGGDPVYENKLHIVDTIPVQQTTTYTLVFAKSATQNNSVAQATTLTEGWNWWSTYIDMSTEQDFNKLKTALGSNASMIKSRTDGFVTYMGGWYGTLQTINNQSMYMINMNSEQTISITGTLANLASNPITINNGWNWIGYPANVSVDINSALVNMTPTESDLIKTRNAFATYYSSMGGWFGSLTSLTPGLGYMYQSNNEEQFEFVYSTITRTDIEPLEVQMTNHWEISVGEYSDNATLIGVIAINGEEQRNENLIIGAFIDDRCVGEANAIYIEPFDRYLVFLTYFGNENDPITFRLYDENTGIETIGSETSLVFNANSMIGSLEEPLVINFTMTTNVNEFAKNAKLFPNPVKALEKVNVGLKNVDASSMKIEIVNTLGMVVYQKTYHSTAIDITAPRLPGIYIVKITEDNGNVYYGKLIVE